MLHKHIWKEIHKVVAIPAPFKELGTKELKTNTMKDFMALVSGMTTYIYCCETCGELKKIQAVGHEVE